MGLRVKRVSGCVCQVTQYVIITVSSTLNPNPQPQVSPVLESLLAVTEAKEAEAAKQGSRQEPSRSLHIHEGSGSRCGRYCGIEHQIDHRSGDLKPHG